MDEDTFTSNHVLTEVEILKLELYQLRVDLRSSILEKLSLREKMEEIEHRRTMKEIQKQKQSLMQEFDHAKQEYNSVFENIQERLGINLEECTIQEDGSLRYIGDSKLDNKEVPE